MSTNDSRLKRGSEKLRRESQSSTSSRPRSLCLILRPPKTTNTSRHCFPLKSNCLHLARHFLLTTAMESLHQRERVWESLIALGFSPARAMDEYAVLVHKNLFFAPAGNVLGMEVLMHFLLTRILASTASVRHSIR